MGSIPQKRRCPRCGKMASIDGTTKYGISDIFYRVYTIPDDIYFCRGDKSGECCTMFDQNDKIWFCTVMDTKKGGILVPIIDELKREEVR